MTVLVGYHPACEGHNPGAGHPESPDRLRAVLDGIARAGVRDAIEEFVPRRATDSELELVHDRAYVQSLAERCRSGGGWLDRDTAVSSGSYEAALRGAGAGLDAIDRLNAGDGDAALLVVRPPGHHALADRAMGFCLFNNVAIAAAALAERGERVLIIDWDAHHGNGTQAAFYDRADVCYISMHQYPFYPGTGKLDEIGQGAGEGTTVNLPFPSGTTGDAYRLAFDEVVVPTAEHFSPSWLLISAGFDAHRLDPLTGLGLTSGDFADLAARASLLVPPSRRLFFLEGGYHLDALRDSIGATVASLVDTRFRPEPASVSVEAHARDQAVNVIADAQRLRRQLGVA